MNHRAFVRCPVNKQKPLCRLYTCRKRQTVLWPSVKQRLCILPISSPLAHRRGWFSAAVFTNGLQAGPWLSTPQKCLESLLVRRRRLVHYNRMLIKYAYDVENEILVCEKPVRCCFDGLLRVYSNPFPEQTVPVRVFAIAPSRTTALSCPALKNARVTPQRNPAESCISTAKSLLARPSRVPSETHKSRSSWPRAYAADGAD